MGEYFLYDAPFVENDGIFGTKAYAVKENLFFNKEAISSTCQIKFIVIIE